MWGWEVRSKGPCLPAPLPPSLQTPEAVVAARLGAFTVPNASVAGIYADHVAWWQAFWGASSVALDARCKAVCCIHRPVFVHAYRVVCSEQSTEAFWYASLYALGSGSRAGHLAMDLWSPWRTTDYRFAVCVIRPWRASRGAA